MCHLALDENTGSNVFVVSITHLAFDPRLPLAREIAAYQKHPICITVRGSAGTMLEALLLNIINLTGRSSACARRPSPISYVLTSAWQ
jgi:hypothetical protein